MDEQRVADYFVVAGLGEGAEPLEEVSNEAAIKSGYSKEPITDITIINRSAGEKVPKNFECLETTPSNFPANLNHGAIRCHDLFICYRRGRDKPPLKDIGILYEGKERLREGCELVTTTPYGRPANLNNSSNMRISLTFRRATETAASDTLVVVDLCIILTNKGEEPPLTYNQILKNLNKGMVGSDVYLCYKKAMVKTDVLAYKASILGRYPEVDYDSFPLPDPVAMFCLPLGATIECWSAKAVPPSPGFSTFILTLAGGEKVYGASLSFYEEYAESKLSDIQMRSLGLKNRTIREQYNIQKAVHMRKAICLLSHWPFFEAFRKFLLELHKLSTSGPHPVPIERHLSHFMYNVPYPSPQRPRILVQLTDDSLSLCMPEDSPLPQSGASFITLLRNLGPELCMNLLMFTLLENKILLHSLRPTVLTEVAEAVTSMIFPFHWQCPYIPLCPLGLSDMLNAPIPFIVGIDSRYFDLYDPPPDIICVDLDTNRLWLPEDKKQMSFKSMPKKAVKILQDSLHNLFAMSSTAVPSASSSSEVTLDVTSVDMDFRRKKKQMQMELLIQEAFLHFMAILLRDYKTYLNPIMKQPSDRATDASFLFDMQGFLKSRERTNNKFYSHMIKTQMFFRFIEERSFVSDKDAGLAFFDECLENLDDTKEDVHLIEIGNSQTSDRTVFILPPEPTDLPEGVTYSYDSFPELKPELFLKKKESTLSLPKQSTLCPNSPMTRRTKQEIKSTQKLAHQHHGNPEMWSKWLVSQSYSLWFISYPAFVHVHTNKLEALKIGLAVLHKMHAAKLAFVDQICYRVLMQLAGQYNKPGVAVQVFSQMKRHGVQPNAITYGYYNKVMLEATWSSPMSRGKRLWTKIRNMVLGIAQFRQALRPRSSLSSRTELDRISHASVDSCQDDLKDKVGGVSSAKVMFSMVQSDSSAATSISGKTGVSDGGYNSMTQDDLRQLTQAMRMETSSQISSPCSPPPASGPDSTTGSNLHPHLYPPTPLAVKSGISPHPVPLISGQQDGLLSDSKDQHDFGNIVCKTIASFCDQDTLHILQGTVLNSTAGLLMVSQSFLEHGAYLASGDLRLEVEQANRQRHKSDCGGKKATHNRSKSMCTSWHPLLQEEEEAKMALPTNISQLAKTNPKSLRRLQCTEQSKVKSETTSTAATKGSVKDSGVGLDEHPNSQESVASGDVVHKGNIEGGGSIGEGDDQGPSSECGKDCSKVSNSTAAPKHHSAKDGVSSICDPLSGLPVERSGIILSDKRCNEPNHDIHTHGAAFRSDSTVISLDGTEGSATCLSSNMNDRESESNDADTGVEDVESGQDMKRGRSSSCFSPPVSASAVVAGDVPLARRQSVLPVSQGVLARDPRLSNGETSLKRSHSLKHARSVDMMQKTNDAINELWKFASKAASASYSKFNELKHTITTPIKNAASISSLTRSQDDLDGGSASKKKGRGESKGSSQKESSGSRLSLKSSQSTLSNTGSHTDAQQLAHASLGESFMGEEGSSSFLEKFQSLQWQVSQSDSASVHSGEEGTVTMAMEVEMSSCSRCSRCHHLVFDEETMSGWSADDSDLNTKCTFCHARFVPNLEVSVKDWRDRLDSDATIHGSGSSPLDSSPSVITPPSSCHSPPGSASPFVFATPPPYCASPGHSSLSSLQAGKILSQDKKKVKIGEGKDTVSSMHLEDFPLTLQEAADAARGRFSSATSLRRANQSSLSEGVIGPLSPLDLSIGEDTPFPTTPDAAPNERKDFMSRSTCTAEPQVFQYLSPLVLRKELEYVLDHEGDLCLAKDSFLDLHPIIFWNLVWYFRRLQIPSHLSGFLLTAGGQKHAEASKARSLYDSRNILIRPLWDNIRIHEETGLPMYMAWRAGHKSTVVDALVMENESFSRPCMHQIISSIQKNDMIAAIKQIVQGRRRLLGRKRRFRSLYREILFLSLEECGRENIDHDAFDREFGLAFDKMSPAEIRRLQPDDKPRPANVRWCRKAFCELDI